MMILHQLKADYNPAQHYHHIPGGCKWIRYSIAVWIYVLLSIAVIITRNKSIGGGQSGVYSVLV
jgi:hypothetical protein